jgi:DNA-binding response OmpR family regulator
VRGCRTGARTANEKESGMPADEKRRRQVLFIDDDEKLCALMRDYLEPYGFDLTVAPTGEAGLQAALTTPFDAVLLDMMLPDIDGLEVLRRLRQESGLPVVILSAQAEEMVRIVSLEMGADDYVPKTFSPRELLARLRAVIRRSQANVGAGQEENGKGSLTVRSLVMDPSSMEARLDGRLLDLTALEFRMLHCMAAHPGRVFSRESLLEMAVGRDFCSFDRSIDMHISSLRRKLGDDPRCPTYIKTVRGMGYTLMKHGGTED